MSRSSKKGPVAIGDGLGHDLREVTEGDRKPLRGCDPRDPVSLGHHGYSVEDGQGRSMMKLFQELRQEMGSSVDQTGGLGRSG